MMKVMDRLPAVPLITCDPYFSLWSGSDRLYETETMHWTGRQKRMTGIARIDGVDYRFMGLGEMPAMEQTDLTVTAFSSRYHFQAAGVKLSVEFWTPLLLDDPDVISRPCSYVDMQASSADRKDHDLEIIWEFSGELVCDGDTMDTIGGGEYALGGEMGQQAIQTAWMGQGRQRPLSHSGDDVTIDWGYLYLAAEKSGESQISFQNENKSLCVSFQFNLVSGESKAATLIAAYDDIVSINYFGRMMPGYWARDGKTIQEAIVQAVRERGELKKRCSDFEECLDAASGEFGPSYKKICQAVYRQTIAAHKLIADGDGKLIFISKECYSNGCAGTVDVTYPSTPLFFLYNQELVLAMIRPIFKFAKMPVWGYDFAPHDVGRYPYVTGQVYGLKADSQATGAVSACARAEKGYVYPMLYQMPAGVDVYLHSKQMPVEECGNILILAAQLVRIGTKEQADEILAQLPLFETWVHYLLEYGPDPGEQLCTDDFAGHLAHNVNLAVKAVMGVEAFSILMHAKGDEKQALRYHQDASQMAESVYQRSLAGDHTKLTFTGEDDSWSLKYNAVWDKIFGSGLWEDEFYRQEIAYYQGKFKTYGVPLDSRKTYTKSDWMMWAASLECDKEIVEKFASHILRFLEKSPDRGPFGDWYWTEDGRQKAYSDGREGVQKAFQNRTVQGGIFMPLLITAQHK